MIRLVVRGIPITQGSHQAIVVGGRGVVVEGGNKDARRRHRDWRASVASVASAWMDQNRQGGALIAGPLVVRLTFALPLAASKPKHTRWFPTGPQSKDVDKLCRAAFDAMTGVLWVDDAQVVALVATKDYGDPSGLTIEIEAAPQAECYGDEWVRSVNWRPAPPPAVALTMPESA